MTGPIDDGPTRERHPSSDTFASTMRSDAPPRRRAGRIVFADDGPPPTLGRFVLRNRLGEGGMGVVYAADDPQLGREVAIKVLDLRASAPAATIGAVTRTLLREARAAARLAHPNVVEVYDVGIEGDVPFVVMELVGGGTLAEWLATARPDRAAIIDVLVQAARGLAAAHRVGLLHRDFKPGNVLLGPASTDARGARTGIRARVADFGLAIALPGDPTREGGFDPEATAMDTVPCVAGTPAFMAPEQHRAEPLDARADQFAFCATAWYALYGRLPYPVPTPHLLAAKLAHEVDPPPGRDVDARLHAVIARGLHPDRERRWPDMDTLVRALTRAPRSIGRRMLVAAGLVVALATTAELAAHTSEQPCSDDASALGTAWDPARRDGVAKVFAGERSAFLVGSGRAVVADLDAWASRWSSVRGRLCDAMRVEQRRSEAGLDRGLACLERLRRGLDGTSRALLDDASVRARAPAVVRGLGRPEDCEQLPGDEVGDPERRRALAEVEAQLGDAEALMLAGDEPRAREVGERVLVRARELDDPRLRTMAAILVGKVLDNAGRSDRGREAMTEAVWAATEAGLDELALQAVVQLVWIEGVTLGDFTTADGWAHHGEALLARIGTPAREEIALARSRAAIAQTDWRLEDARVQYERALARLSEVDDELLAGGIEYNYGAFLLLTGAPELAIAAFERSVARSEAIYGPEHPFVGDELTNIAVARSDLGQHEPALADARRALAILFAASGRLDLRVAKAHGILGFVANAAGEHETALASFSEAWEIQRALMGDDHGVTATYEARIGVELAIEGRLDEGRRRVEHAIAIHRAVAPHGELGMSLTSAALVEIQAGRPAEALARLDEAIAIFRRVGDDREVEKLESMAAPLRTRP